MDTYPWTLARVTRRLLRDPVSRGNSWIFSYPKKSYSLTDCGTTVLESYVKLLVLEAAGQCLI